MKTYKYDLIDNKTYDVITTLTSNEVYKKYGIKDVNRFLVTNNNPILCDGNILLEHPSNEDKRVKCFLHENDYDFYIDNYGIVTKIDRSNRNNRVNIEILHDINNCNYIYINGTKYNISELTKKYFGCTFLYSNYVLDDELEY